MTDLAVPIAVRSDDMTAWAQHRDPLLGGMPAPVLDEHVVAQLSSASRGAIAVARVVRTPSTDARSLWGATTTDHLQLRLDESATEVDVAEVLDAWPCRAPASVEEPSGDHARVLRRRRAGLGDEYVDHALGYGEAWTHVATHDGTVVGWAGLAPPAESTWAAPSTSAERVAYLGIASVTARARSRGVGRALVAALHAQAHAAGVDATLLDASVLNPWSMPFWHRAGYWPRWTTWQRIVPTR